MTSANKTIQLNGNDVFVTGYSFRPAALKEALALDLVATKVRPENRAAILAAAAECRAADDAHPETIAQRAADARSETLDAWHKRSTESIERMGAMGEVRS